MDQNFDMETPEFKKELKRIRRRLRRRNFCLVLTSLVLTAALAFGILRFVVPALEKQYWDPSVQNYDQYDSDLTLTMSAYAELFCPDQIICYVNATRTGFAAYTLSVSQWHTKDHGDVSYLNAALDKGELSFSPGFWEYVPGNVFERACLPEYDMGEEFDQRTRDSLATLPEYIHVQAAVSFPEDLTMEEIRDLFYRLEGGMVDWVGIRVCDMDRQVYPLCGMKPTSGGIIREQINESYPDFDIKTSNSAEAYASHFKALLQYSLDRVNEGTGISPNSYLDYYREALDYVNENGVTSYGAYITASPQTLLELQAEGIISQIWPREARIHF